MKGKSKTQKGITLIALIITIVVLLILAVVAVNSIQNDGILGHAQNAAGTYNQAVANEQSMLQEYQDYLTGINGGSEAYTVGQEVKVVDKDGVEHQFYVIKDSSNKESKVLLLAKECIDTTNLVQSSSANKIAFSEPEYCWKEDLPSNMFEYNARYDLIETGVPDESHYAAYAAYQYGVKLGGVGRLMTCNEAETLRDTNDNLKAIIYGTETANGYLEYYLGTANSEHDLWYVEYTGYNNYGTGDLSVIDNLYSGNMEGQLCVRPVVEISKSKVALVTAQ